VRLRFWRKGYPDLLVPSAARVSISGGRYRRVIIENDSSLHVRGTLVADQIVLGVRALLDAGDVRDPSGGDPTKGGPHDIL